MNRDDDLPLVSAVVTTYNRPGFLRNALESVEAQTYPRIELVVVDDCSAESPEPVVEEVDRERFEDVKFYRHNENSGVSAARNTGIAESTGELIAFLDDDDVWERSKIEKQVSVFESSDRVGAVYTGIRSVDSNGATITIDNPTRSGDLTKELLCGFGVWFPTLLVDRGAVESTGRFNEEMEIFEDQEWVVRLSQHTEFDVVPQPLYFTRRGDSHEQLSDDVESKLKNGHARLMETYSRIAADYDVLSRKKAYGHVNFDMGRMLLAGRRPKLARSYFSRALRYWPLSFEFYAFFVISVLGTRSYIVARNAKRTLSNQYF